MKIILFFLSIILVLLFLPFEMMATPNSTFHLSNKKIQKQLDRKMSWKERVVFKHLKKKLKRKKGLDKFIKQWLIALLTLIIALISLLFLARLAFPENAISTPLGLKVIYGFLILLFIFVLSRPIKGVERIKAPKDDPFIFEQL